MAVQASVQVSVQVFFGVLRHGCAPIWVLTDLHRRTAECARCRDWEGRPGSVGLLLAAGMGPAAGSRLIPVIVGSLNFSYQ